MKLPKIENAEKYTGLYIIDFGDSSSVGFVADEVAELLESEKFKDATVYKIHKAFPDGTMELKGVPAEIFQLEAGMFFYESDLATAQSDYKRLINAAITSSIPSRAKVNLSKYSDDKFVTAIIYPAEFDDEFSAWLLKIDYKTSSEVCGGTESVKRYYDQSPEILERHQFFADDSMSAKTGMDLLISTKRAMVR